MAGITPGPLAGDEAPAFLVRALKVGIRVIAACLVAILPAHEPARGGCRETPCASVT